MNRQNINIGSIANDGTGDSIRQGGDKINDNFIELYNAQGWGYYEDDETSTQSITSTASKLSINGLGSNNNEDYLPGDILGSGSLWDTTNNKITPIGLGDGYNLRIDFGITAKTGSPNYIEVILDVGGSATITNVEVESIISCTATTPFQTSISFPFFSLANFNANGGQIFLRTDTGTATLTKRAISIYRNYKGDPYTP